MDQFNSSNLDESMAYEDDDDDDDFVEIEKQQPRRQVEQRQLLQQQQQQQQVEERIVIQEGLDDEPPSESLNASSEYEFKQDMDTNSIEVELNTSNNSFVVVAAAHQPKRLRNKKVF